MHRHRVGARLHEIGDVALGTLDHEVDVEHRPGGVHLLGDARDDQRTDGDRRHEVPVHHVHVDDPGTGVENLGDLFAETAEVGREDRWRHTHAAQQRLRARGHIGCSIDSPQWLHLRIAVEDILTIVECSPQLGHTDVSSKRCRQ